MKLLQETIAHLKPTPKEEKQTFALINKVISKIKMPRAKAILGGSGAKGTWLKTAHDADIFVLFDPKYYDTDKISAVLGKELHKRFKKVFQLHGSRDYYQVPLDGFTIEIVPIMKIAKAEQAYNITDVSPLHTLWVKKNTTSKLRDEIRLIKQFCKANGVYGAESYINGFSGYVLEILTIYYGGFLKLVKAVSRWKDRPIIDIKKYYKTKHQLMMDINKSKLVSPLIVIDPVQKDRNAAAAIDSEKYHAFIDACKRFLKEPSRRFFEIKPFSIEELKKKETHHKKLHLLKAKTSIGKRDIVGCKLLKVYQFLRKRLVTHGFQVYDSGWHWDTKQQCYYWFLVDKKPLPAMETREGPPAHMKKHVAVFRKKYKNAYTKNKRLYAEVKKSYREAKDYLKILMKDSYVAERVKNLEWQK